MSLSNFVFSLFLLKFKSTNEFISASENRFFNYNLHRRSQAREDIIYTSYMAINNIIQIIFHTHPNCPKRHLYKQITLILHTRSTLEMHLPVHHTNLQV